MQKIQVFLIFILFSISQLKAQNLDKELEAIITPLITSISGQSVKNIAIADFTLLDGTPTELGKYLAEEFTYSLVSSPKKTFGVIDRSRVSALLKENNLGSTGTVDPNTIVKLGKMKGIDAVIAGVLTSTGNTLRLNIKVWNLETQNIVAVARGDISKTPMISELGDKTVLVGSSGGGSSTPAKLPSPSIPKFTKDNLVFELTSCTQTGDRVECRVRVTSIGKDNDLQAWGGPKRIISSTGNEYQLDEIKLGDKLNDWKSFVADIPVNCVFSAPKVNEKIDFIAKLEVYFRDRFTMEIRNIKVK